MGQQNIPNNDSIDTYVTGILERQYYTESGPLVKTVEKTLSTLLGVNHVICVSNATIAWLMLLEAEELRGTELFATGSTSLQFLSAANWLKCNVHFIDAQQKIFGQERSTLEKSISPHRASRYVLTNSLCSADGLHLAHASKHIKTSDCLFESSESFLCAYKGKTLGSIGKAELFNFDPKNLINGQYGAVIASNDDYLADYLRNMRGSGGVLRKVKTRLTTNGRMSEAQAAFILMSIDNVESWINRNKEQYEIYLDKSTRIEDIEITSAVHTSVSNCQQFSFVTKTQEMYDTILTKAAANGLEFIPIGEPEADLNAPSEYKNRQFLLPISGHLTKSNIASLSKCLFAI